MDTEINNNQGEKPAAPEAAKKDRLAVTAIIVLLVAIIAYAGYEYFWLSLKRRELANSGTNTVSTTTPKKAIGGDKISAEPAAAENAKKTKEQLVPLEAVSSGPATIKITGLKKTFVIGLVINSDCQSPVSGDTVASARKTASLWGLSLNGVETKLKEARILVCTYPLGVKEAYIPDPRLNVTGVDQAAKKVFFSLTGAENQGSGRETAWQKNFIFNLGDQTIVEK